MTTATLDRVFSAVSDPTRRAILARLADSDARVTDLAGEFPISLNSTSKHIRVLEGAGLVRREVRGREHILSIEAEPLAEAAEWIEHYRRFWSDQLASLDRFVTRRGRKGSDRRRRVHRDRAARDRRPGADAVRRVARPEKLGAWMRPRAISETRAETDPRVGGEFRIVMVRDRTDLVHRGTYREIDPPSRLVFTWSSPATDHRDSVVTVTFEPARSGSTLVEIHQVGLPDDASAAGHTEGWSDALAKLERLHA